ncbi:hypothetical protein K435DRAFT_751561 [Dendrothele bispora CBS 962.96]|uniref:Mitochondrial carrier n=1 Tax=Dendrothele bispora (strain CBS 962.96) TaxID=1314807 RepID=A0A4S8MBU1_DENBC|nr:hypothetical protein K435DRAFT_751561 [Dendrothele bispora CBS 962.96]
MFLFLIPVPVLLAIFFTPFMSTLVRYRANYEPRNVQLDGENSQPIVDGYFSMLKRIYALEGWEGLYKGSLCWLCIQFLLYYLYSYLFLAVDYLVHAILPFRFASTLLFIARMLYSLAVGIPTSVVLYRAVCTPYVLPYFSPGIALSVLLSPTERRKPWKLYFTPGLLILHFVLNTPVKAIETSGTLVWHTVAGGHLALYLVAVLLTSVVLSPLPVMIIRLSLQRNHDYYDDSDPLISRPRTEGELAAHYGLRQYCNDSVIGLRDEDDPYTSLLDCFNRMLHEESWRVFYRAYWATFFGQIQWLLYPILYYKV